MITKKNLPKLSDAERFLKEPDLVTGEILFLILTLCNVFIIYRLFLDVIPFPIFVTWWQLMQGLVMAWILGEMGYEFPKFSYFPQVQIKQQLFKELLIPTIVYCIMLVLANILLSKTPTPATFPVVVSFAVIMHHVVRFIGCGEEYMGLRWQSMLILFFGFVLGSTDHRSVGPRLLSWALGYAFMASLFRAGYLQKIMHTVEGKGNSLHNHQHIIGVILLPFAWIIVGEWKVLTSMPYSIFSLHTWQMWGCLVTAGALPFIKNIVSNRLIKKTGQAPWRFLEIISIFLVFCIGLPFGVPGWQGWVAILLVILGRSVGAIDAVKNAEDVADELSDFMNQPRTRYSSNPVDREPEGATALLSSFEKPPSSRLSEEVQEEEV